MLLICNNSIYYVFSRLQGTYDNEYLKKYYTSTYLNIKKKLGTIYKIYIKRVTKPSFICCRGFSVWASNTWTKHTGDIRDGRFEPSLKEANLKG
jgi:hypothetical protein